MVSESQRLILRAELLHQGRRIVGHTMEISDSSALVRTDESLDVGDRILVRLSFPRFVAAFELEAHVVSKTYYKAPGEPAGVTLVFVFRSEDERRRIVELLGSDEPLARSKAPALRALLVEDSAMIRDMVLFGARKHFGPAGSLWIDIAETTERAWSMLAGGGYDLVVVDFFLPGDGNGADLVGRMRGEPALAGVPVVAISVGGKEAREAFLTAGADLFLDKPLVIRDFFSTLGRLVGERTE